MNAPMGKPVGRFVQRPIQRRERRPVDLEGHAILEDGSIIAVKVTDLSYEGCGIDVPQPLKPGSAIRLSVLRRGVIEGHVRWYFGGKAGVIFEADATPPGEGAKPRQGERFTLVADVTMRRQGKHSFGVTIFDASRTGCRVEFVERPDIGERVRITFKGLQPLDGRVCWVDCGCAGVQFERPIHPAVFDLLLARLINEAQRA